MGKTKNFAKFKFLSILIDKLLAFLALTQFLELRHPGPSYKKHQSNKINLDSMFFYYLIVFNLRTSV